MGIEDKLAGGDPTPVSETVPMWTPTAQQCRRPHLYHGELRACGVSVQIGGSCNECGVREDGSNDMDPDG